ncbi:MAG TPA: hypothetical protein VFH47_07305, partial [Candidatus Thermoplasmatota archaeon]|nr:hypothetical protein [Candidatus Thermoplasmatota archaeon]
LGVAASRLSPAFREAHPQVPWRSLASLREVLLQGDEAVAPEKVWAAVSGPLKEAMPVLRRLAAGTPAEAED